MTGRKIMEAYCDDQVQLSRYRSLVESLCAKEVARIRDMSYVDTVQEPVYMEEPHGVHVSLHDVFADNASDAVYEVSYRFFVAYYGRFRLEELSVEPVPPASSCIDDIGVDDLPFWGPGSEQGNPDGNPDEPPSPAVGCAVFTYGGQEGGGLDG